MTSYLKRLLCRIMGHDWVFGRGILGLAGFVKMPAECKRCRAVGIGTAGPGIGDVTRVPNAGAVAAGLEAFRKERAEWVAAQRKFDETIRQFDLLVGKQT